MNSTLDPIAARHPHLRQRGADGYPVGSDSVLREAYGKISGAWRFQHRYGYERPVKVHGWEWSTTFGRWSALVTFADDWRGFTYPEPLSVDGVRGLESEACGRIVGLGGGTRTRQMVADVLRSWRALGDNGRANWFRRHAYYITGTLWKDRDELSAQSCEVAAVA